MKRAQAWAVDCFPLIVFAAYTAPSVLALFLIRGEAAEGIFDPSWAVIRF
jgi:hypothetical protein